MKKQKLFAISGLLLSVAFLAGCGSASVSTEKRTTPASSATSADAGNNIATDSSQVALPGTVSTQPGATADDEIKNIDKDLQAMDASNSQDSLSDKDLGL